MSLPTLSLHAKLESALLSNHPWVYRNHLPKHALQTGDWVRVRAGQAHRIGLYDDESAIALRLFGDDQVPDYEWVDSRVKDALTLRDVFTNQEVTNAYRLLFGEGDFLPGVTVDRYERYAVLQTYAASVEVVVPDIVKSLSKHLNLRGVVQKTQNGIEPRYAQLPPPEVTIQENGLRLIANLYEGQKTGLFSGPPRQPRYVGGRLQWKARAQPLLIYGRVLALRGERARGARHKRRHRASRQRRRQTQLCHERL